MVGEVDNEASKKVVVVKNDLFKKVNLPPTNLK